jgi:hypothetical protein
MPSRFDPFLGDTELRHPYQLLLSAAWDEFNQRLEGDPDSWLLESILANDDAAVETIVFRRLCDARPAARAFALLGGAIARDAHNLLLSLRSNPRLPYRVTDLPPSAEHNEAEILLGEAEEALHQAVRLRPALAAPWVHLLASGRLLGFDLPELRTRFENSHSRLPFRPDACCQYLLGLSARGGGSDDAMFNFARWVTNESPADSPARIVLPMAHLQYGLGPAASSLTDHLAAAATVEELAPALDAYLQATSPEASSRALGTLNVFALALTVSDPATARLMQECYRRIDNRPTAYPWTLYEDEVIPAVFAEVQRTQLRSVSRFL